MKNVENVCEEVRTSARPVARNSTERRSPHEKLVTVFPGSMITMPLGSGVGAGVGTRVVGTEEGSCVGEAEGSGVGIGNMGGVGPRVGTGVRAKADFPAMRKVRPLPELPIASSLNVSPDLLHPEDKQMVSKCTTRKRNNNKTA